MRFCAADRPAAAEPLRVMHLQLPPPAATSCLQLDLADTVFADKVSSLSPAALETLECLLPAGPAQ
jgi:hypothetical protein